MRPELLHVLGRVVEHRARGVSDGATAADDEAVTALCRVLSLAPHTAPLVARYMALAPFPLARAGEVGDPGTRRWLAHAALHLVHCAASTGDAQLRLLVTSHEVTSHALRLLACHDEHVRWAAIVILARGLHMAPAQVEALRRRCLTPQEVRHTTSRIGWLPAVVSRLLCFLCLCRKWMRSSAGTTSAPPWPSSAPAGCWCVCPAPLPPPRAAPLVKQQPSPCRCGLLPQGAYIAHPRNLKIAWTEATRPARLGHNELATSADTLPCQITQADDDSVAVAVDDVDASATPVQGYVHVCGVHIKCRTHTAACPPPSPEQLPRLVVTPSVQANMDTFAHALCGGRPILLEGPPGCGKSSMLRYFASLTGACVWGMGTLLCPAPPSLSVRLGSVVPTSVVWLRHLRR